LGNKFAKGNLRCLRTATAAGGSRIANFAGRVKETNIPGLTFATFNVTDSENGAGDMLSSDDPVSATCHAPTGGENALTSSNIVVRTG
jgi:hypothetical protein